MQFGSVFTYIYKILSLLGGIWCICCNIVAVDCLSVEARREVLQRELRHRWSIFQHFSATMEPSKKIKTSDMKTIICFIAIRFSVGTKNLLRGGENPARRDAAFRAVYRLCAHNERKKKWNPLMKQRTFIRRLKLFFNKIFIKL